MLHFKSSNPRMPDENRWRLLRFGAMRLGGRSASNAVLRQGGKVFVPTLSQGFSSKCSFHSQTGIRCLKHALQQLNSSP